MALTEKALIAEIRTMARVRGSRGVLAGIGDDCAVLRTPPGHDVLVTTDFSLEGVHFRREWHPAESVGHRCLTRGLSDIAAMGGDPVAAFLSLALPRDVPQAWVTKFTRGLLRLAREHGVPLAGGDTAESPHGILADIVVVGSVPKGEAVTRSGARPGDRICVSGLLGGSAAAVKQMEAGQKLKPREWEQHFYPEPRLAMGRVLREKGLASAMIDVSDGLSTDLAHICEESGVGAEISLDAIPLASVGKRAGEVDLDLALHGGEDYELLFTVPSAKRIPQQVAGVPISQIGCITRRRKIFAVDPDGASKELRPRGWEHFRS